MEQAGIFLVSLEAAAFKQWMVRKAVVARCQCIGVGRNTKVRNDPERTFALCGKKVFRFAKCVEAKSQSPPPYAHLLEPSLKWYAKSPTTKEKTWKVELSTSLNRSYSKRVFWRKRNICLTLCALDISVVVVWNLPFRLSSDRFDDLLELPTGHKSQHE